MVDLKIKLPEGFLDEEVRCGYLVTSEMKKVWAVMLDLLVEFDRVCQKHQLKYLASWGTMLGAVRHKGFIPWDDDLDVQMFRDDYDKLLEIAPQEFKSPYFFQSKYTDPGMGYLCCKLRNSETTALSPEEKYSVTDYNKGIFIDVFPVDRIPDDEEERKALFSSIKQKRLSVIREGRKIGVFSESKKFLQRSIKRIMYQLLSRRRRKHLPDFLREYTELNELCKQYNATPTEQVAMLMFYPPESNIMSYDDYRESVLMDFEFLKIPVAKGYDHALKTLYGDYHKFYIKEKHTDFFDTDRSYREYC